MRLFEMERAAQAALTSCAWFFDDFGGPEGRVVLRWAARAVELAAEFALEHRARIARAAAPDPFQPPRNRRRRHTIFEPQDARGAREGMMPMARHRSTTISNRYCASGASFRPRAEFSRRAHVKSLAEYEALYRRAEQDPEGILGECASELIWFKPFDQGAGMELPVREVVRRRRAQRLLQLSRSASDGPRGATRPR